MALAQGAAGGFRKSLYFRLWKDLNCLSVGGRELTIELNYVDFLVAKQPPDPGNSVIRVEATNSRPRPRPHGILLNDAPAGLDLLAYGAAVSHYLRLPAEPTEPDRCDSRDHDQHMPLLIATRGMLWGVHVRYCSRGTGRPIASGIARAD